MRSNVCLTVVAQTCMCLFFHDCLHILLVVLGGHSPYKDYAVKVHDDVITQGLSNYVVSDELCTLAENVLCSMDYKCGNRDCDAQNPICFLEQARCSYFLTNANRLANCDERHPQYCICHVSLQTVIIKKRVACAYVTPFFFDAYVAVCCCFNFSADRSGR